MVVLFAKFQLWLCSLLLFLIFQWFFFFCPSLFLVFCSGCCFISVYHFVHGDFGFCQFCWICPLTQFVLGWCCRLDLEHHRLIVRSLKGNPLFCVFVWGIMIGLLIYVVLSVFIIVRSIIVLGFLLNHCNDVVCLCLDHLLHEIYAALSALSNM